MKYGIKLLAPLLFLTFASHIHAQDDSDAQVAVEEEVFQALIIGGVITDENDKNLKGVKVELYEGNEVVDAFSTKGNGKFKFQLLNDHLYTIQLSKDGYLLKRVSVNTALPKDDDNTYYFDFDLGLIPVAENAVADETLYEYPSAIIEFNDKKSSFYFDENYTKQLMRDIRTSTVN